MGRLVGYGVSQVPTNGMLGGMAYQDPINVTVNNISISGAYVSGNLGVGTTNPTSKLTVQGDVLVSGILTASRIVGTSLSISGISTIANFIMTPVGTGATVGGIGVVTYYGDGSGLTKINSSAIVGVSTYADRAGISTYADNAGIATNVIGGIASISQLNVSGITTLGVTSTTNLTSRQLNVTGISTLGITSTTNLTSQQLLVTGITTLGITSISQLNVSGITTLRSIVGTSLSITGISTIANFLITNVGAGATVGGIGVVTYYGDGSGLTKINSSAIVGVTTYADRAGIATNVIGGIASVSQLQVSGISTFTNGPILVGSATSTGTSLQRLQVTGGAYVSGNLGIGTTNPTAKLDVRGDVSIASTLGIGTVIDIVPYDTLNSGTLSWEGSAGQLFSITNNLTTGSIYSVNDVSGIPSIDVDANGTIQLGPYGGNIGLGTTNPTSKLHVLGTSLITGISTIANFIMTPVGTGATVGGIGVTYYGDGSQLENIAVDYADRSGISTNVIGGIASVSQLNVTGITTLTSIVGTSLSISGITTLGVTSTTNLTSQQLNVTGITTLTSIVGTSLSISGISTIANFLITNVGTGATVGGIGVVTYYGDGSNLTGVSAFSVQQQDIITSPVYPTFASNIGTSSLGIAATELVYIPASGNLGIGTTTPTSKLTVVGDVFVSGVLTATRLYSGIYGEFVGGSISGSDIVGTSLSITGISTLGITSTTNLTTQQLNVSGLSTFAGIATHTASLFGTQASFTGVVTASSFVGSGAGLTGLVGAGSGVTITANTTNQSQFLTYVTQTGNVAGLGVTTGGLVFNPSTTRLGIGTATPRANLDVTDSILISTGVAQTADFLLKSYTNNNGTLSFENADSSFPRFAIDKDTSYLFRINDNNFVTKLIINNSGDVNISGVVTATNFVGDGSQLTGVLAPVNGAISVTGLAVTGPSTFIDSIQISPSAGSTSSFLLKSYTNNNGTLSFENADSSFPRFGIDKDTSYLFRINDNNFVTKLTVNNSGNLGIGTTTPTSKLAVVGDVTATNFIGNGSQLTGVPSFNVIGGIASVTALNVTGLSTFIDSIQISPSAGSTTRFSLKSYTNNGGTLSFENADSSFPRFGIDKDTSYLFRINDNNFVTKLTVNNSGNLGIGTTTPTSRLTVIGDTLITGISTIGNLTITPVGTGATVGGVGVVTYYGDGRNLTNVEDYFVIAASDETTNLGVGTNKVFFRMPYAATLLAVRATVNTAPTGSTLIVDINENGTSVLGTKLSIDISEKTSTTAASAATITDSALADDAEITIDIDQVGSTIPGKGLKVYLKTRRN